MAFLDALTSIFTGAPQKDAAAKSQQFLQNTLQTGRADLAQGYNTGAGAIQAGTTAARPILAGTYGQARGDIGGGANEALGYIDTGTQQAQGALGQARAAYSPLTQLGQKYGGATSLQLDALGVNGPEGMARAQQAFQAGPGYQWQLEQGLEGLNRQRAASGMLASGNAGTDAMKYASGLANQAYGDWRNSLGNYISPELSATSGAATGIAGVDTNEANLLSAAGGARAGVATQRGSMLADLASRYGTGAAGLETGQGAQLANLATSQGQNQVNLATGLAKPYTDAYKAAADAQTQGSANLWGLGLNLATLGTGVLGQSGLLRR